MGGGWDAETPSPCFQDPAWLEGSEGDAALQGGTVQETGTACPASISQQGMGEQPEHLPLLS